MPLLLRRDLAIDPGSHSTVLAPGQGGLLVREPTRIALFAPRFAPGVGLTQVAALGAEIPAKIAGRRGVRVIEPVQHGRLADAQAMHLLLEALLKRVIVSGWSAWLLGRRCTLVVPGHLTAAELERYRELARDLSLGRVLLSRAEHCAARGCALDIAGHRAQMLVDIGGGKTYAAVFALGDLAGYAWAPFGGDDLNEAVRYFVRQRRQVDLTSAQAEHFKRALGSVYPKAQPEQLAVTGVDTRSGFDKKVTLDDNELRDVLIDACEPAVAAIQRCLADLPPEMAGDIQEQGVLLTGGGALLEGLSAFLMERMGLPFRLAPDPLNATIRGAQALLAEGLES